MPRGGFRPGAGRKKTSVSAAQAAQEPRKASEIAAAADPAESAEYILSHVQRGLTQLPDGRKITPLMVQIAKERLPFERAKLATTNNQRGADFHACDFTDDDLAAFVAAGIELVNRFGRTGTAEGDGGRAGIAAAAAGP